MSTVMASRPVLGGGTPGAFAQAPYGPCKIGCHGGQRLGTTHSGAAGRQGECANSVPTKRHLVYAVRVAHSGPAKTGPLTKR